MKLDLHTILLVGALAIGGYFVYTQFIAPKTGMDKSALWMMDHKIAPRASDFKDAPPLYSEGPKFFDNHTPPLSYASFASANQAHYGRMSYG